MGQNSSREALESATSLELLARRAEYKKELEGIFSTLEEFFHRSYLSSPQRDENSLKLWAAEWEKFTHVTPWEELFSSPPIKSSCGGGILAKLPLVGRKTNQHLTPDSFRERGISCRSLIGIISTASDHVPPYPPEWGVAVATVEERRKIYLLIVQRFRILLHIEMQDVARHHDWHPGLLSVTRLRMVKDFCAMLEPCHSAEFVSIALQEMLVPEPIVTFSENTEIAASPSFIQTLAWNEKYNWKMDCFQIHPIHSQVWFHRELPNITYAAVLSLRLPEALKQLSLQEEEKEKYHGERVLDDDAKTTEGLVEYMRLIRETLATTVKSTTSHITTDVDAASRTKQLLEILLCLNLTGFKLLGSQCGRQQLSTIYGSNHQMFNCFLARGIMYFLLTASIRPEYRPSFGATLTKKEEGKEEGKNKELPNPSENCRVQKEEDQLSSNKKKKFFPEDGAVESLLSLNETWLVFTDPNPEKAQLSRDLRYGDAVELNEHFCPWEIHSPSLFSTASVGVQASSPLSSYRPLDPKTMPFSPKLIKVVWNNPEGRLFLLNHLKKTLIVATAFTAYHRNNHSKQQHLKDLVTQEIYEEDKASCLTWWKPTGREIRIDAVFVGLILGMITPVDTWLDEKKLHETVSSKDDLMEAPPLPGFKQELLEKWPAPSSERLQTLARIISARMRILVLKKDNCKTGAKKFNQREHKGMWKRGLAHGYFHAPRVDAGSTYSLNIIFRQFKFHVALDRMIMLRRLRWKKEEAERDDDDGRTTPITGYLKDGRLAHDPMTLVLEFLFLPNIGSPKFFLKKVNERMDRAAAAL